MKIEHAHTSKHIHSIKELADEIWSEHYTSIIGAAQVEYMLKTFQSTEAIRKQMENGSIYYLILSEDEPVGYMSVEAKRDEIFVSKLYVKASKRRQGYAKAAIDSLLKLPRTHRQKKLSLTVNKNNRLAIAFYEKMGFKNCGSTVKGIGEGFFMDDYIMRKQL